MNKKSTNRLVAILNVLIITSMYIAYFSINYLSGGIISGANGGKTVYGNIIIDFFVNNINFIFIVQILIISVINIICAIQNIKNKRLSFWQFLLGVFAIFVLGVSYVITNDIMWYIIFMIISAINIIMQFIYIHLQDNYIEESSRRKITNIIVYYVLYTIVSIGSFLIIVSAVLISKINMDRWQTSLFELLNEIPELNGATIKDVYIPVENNYIYGFIDTNGEEKIPCQYDRVSYFNEMQINGHAYYIAIAKKDNKFYIISKTDNTIEINSVLQKYLTNIDNYLSWQPLKYSNEDSDNKYRLAYIQSFETLLQMITKGEIQVNQQVFYRDNYDNDNQQIDLIENGSNYICKNEKYYMLIEPVDDMKYKVTVTKSNGEKEASIVYLPGINENDATLETFTNGYIEFEKEDEKRKGWYDYNGDQVSIQGDYTIKDIKDNKVILQVDDNKDEMNFVIIDMSGNKLLQTSVMDIYDNTYLIKKSDKKMVLVDKDLKVITNEYDKIITTTKVDISRNYCSYY